MTLFYIGSLTLLILLMITFKILKYQTGEKNIKALICSVIFTLITMSKDTQTE
jgi:hypothetical protein